MHRALFRIVGIALVLVIGQTALSTERSKVETKDGKTYVGEVTKRADGVVIDQNGIKLKIESSRIKSITPLGSVRKEYVARLAKIEDGDAEGHYKLALWCRYKGLTDLVITECEAVLKADADHRQAKLLMRLAKRSQKRSPVKKPQKATPAEAGKDPGPAEDTALISEADVQKLRFAEIVLPNPTDDSVVPDRVPIQFTNKVRQRFWDQMQGKEGFQTRGDRTTFFRMKPIEQLGVIVRETKRDYQPDIRINGDPKVFMQFKTRIWPIVSANCATSNCHAGPNAVGFRLYTSPARGVRQLYTNFLILSSLRAKDGLLVNRDRVEESLLLSYGLPEKETKKPHPGKIKPMCRNPRDPKYRMLEDWIYLLLRDPAYGVKVPGRSGGGEEGGKQEGEAKAGGS